MARAIAAASDLAALTQLRRELRQRFADSPLRDADGLARAIEATYRALWEVWCDGDIPRLHRLYTEGDMAGAEQLADRMLQRDHADIEAHHVLGLLDYRKQRFRQADGHFQAAIARAPDRAELHANHAAVLRSLGRLKDAESAARTALALDQQQVGAHNNLGNILRDWRPIR